MDQDSSADGKTRPLYVFLDEGRDLNFSPTGTKYFTLTSIALFRPFPFEQTLAEPRYDLIEFGKNIHYFHASEDSPPVRQRVFRAIQPYSSSFDADCLVVDKRRVIPPQRAEERFYPETLGLLLKHVITQRRGSRMSQVIVITDRLPIKHKRRAVEKAVKVTLARTLPTTVPHRVLHFDARSCWALQVADDVSWALFRKWERNDDLSYGQIRSAIRSEIERFDQDHPTWY